MTEPIALQPERGRGEVPTCPTCGHAMREGKRLTARELDVLASWWMTGSVKAAATLVGVGEQRAKNLLHRARIRNGAASNDELLAQHFAAVRTIVTARMSHNVRGGEA